MSYIRSGSNPEGLYIWGDGEGKLFVAKDGNMKAIPKDDFHGIILAWWNNDEDLTELTFGDAKMVQNPNTFKWTLHHKSWNNEFSVEAWDVTWHYLVCDIKWRDTPDETRP